MSAVDLDTFELDIVRSAMRPAVRVAALMVATGGGFLDELDRLRAKYVTPLLRFPMFDDLAFEAEIVGELANETAARKAAAFYEQAARRSPGLLYQCRTPSVPPLTGLAPYHAAITEPRDQALARQRDAIHRTIKRGAKIGAACRELARRKEGELPFLANPSPAAKSAHTRRLRREVAEERGFVGGRIPLAPRVLVAGSQGTGKTREALEALTEVRERIAVRFAVPLLSKAEEALGDGATFAFIEALDNFSIAVFLTNIDTTTLPIEAYSYIREIDDPTVAAMATILTLLSIAVVALIDQVLGLDRFLDVS